MSADLVDLTATSARTERDSLASRIDVLDKVGVLRTLPVDLHVTTDMVAEFYEVPIEAIRQTVKRNREELDDDGYQVLSRSEFESDIASLSNLDPKVRLIGLYPRRAVLRIGMLLRDSAVARRDIGRRAVRAASDPADVRRGAAASRESEHDRGLHQSVRRAPLRGDQCARPRTAYG